MALLELLAIVPVLLSTVAHALGPLGPVSAVHCTTPLFVLGLTAAPNRIVPGFVPDDTARGRLFQRLVLTAGILLGVILIRF